MSLWRKFRYEVERKFPNYVGALNAGASREEVENFQNDLGVQLPESFFDLYTESNGQNEKTLAYFFGMEFLSIGRIKKAIEAELELQEQLKSEWDMCSSFPINHIRQAYVNPKWLPIFHGGGETYIGIDFDPEEKGETGQIINFGIDDEDKFVFASSLAQFLKDCTEKLIDGSKINYSDEYQIFSYTDLFFSSALAKELMETNV